MIADLSTRENLGDQICSAVATAQLVWCVA
jgi:hypothetical protein